MNYAQTVIVIGEAGVGKSTLINAILGEDKAEEGIGPSSTKKTTAYSTIYNDGADNYSLTLIDTKGVESDEEYGVIRFRVKEAMRNHATLSRQYILWCCVNKEKNRKQEGLVSIVQKLAIECEIPFIFVITQALQNENNELEQNIQSSFPGVFVLKVISKRIAFRGASREAHGVPELVRASVKNYDLLKANVRSEKYRYELELRQKCLEESIRQAEWELEQERRTKQWRIQQIREAGQRRIKLAAKAANQLGWFSVFGLIPIHVECIELIYDLDKIAGIQLSMSAEDFFTNFVKGIVASVFIAIPLLGPVVAEEYITGVGQSYLDSLIRVLERSSEQELRNKELVTERLKEELRRGVIFI